MPTITSPAPAATENRTLLWVNLITVYILWGSTYLFVHFMTEHMPVLYMASLRFIIAGSILYLFARLTGAPRPTPSNWRAAAVVGGLLLTIANGAVATAVHYLPTGFVALLVAILPLFVLVLNWVFFARERPTNMALLGSALGVVGLLFLLRPGQIKLPGGTHALAIGFGLTILANVAWAFGTLLTPRLNMAKSPTLSTSTQMLAGGAMMFVLALLTEPVSVFSIIKAPSLAFYSLAYLVVFGSIIGFSAFAWLARNAPPSLVSTYAYVNPIVALLLGAAFAGEAVSTQSMLGAAIIIGGVVLITMKPPTPKGS